MKLPQLDSLAVALVACLAYGVVMPAASAPATQNLLVYIGTYTGAKSKGIYVSSFDPVTGKLSAPELAAETASPSFLALHPNSPFLYAVGETSDFGGKGTGSVSAYRLDSKTGGLTLLNRQTSGGSGPCHLAVDRSGTCLLVANYGSGSIAVLPLQPEGNLREPSVVLQHKGSSANPQRQAGPHAHFITAAPGNHFVLVCDLGLDKVLVYRLEATSGSLEPNEPAGFSVQSGSGPRHLAFHPKGSFVYLINELSSSVSVLKYDSQAGTLRELQTVSSLPPDFKGNNSCAEIQVHPSGKFVYASNRGHNSIAVFAVEPKTGRLTLVAHQATQGRTPRHFALDPAGHWLLAANQDSDNVVVFRVDGRTGRLTSTDQGVSVGSPVCLQFVARN